jgi:hypothetical protein
MAAAATTSATSTRVKYRSYKLQVESVDTYPTRCAIRPRPIVHSFAHRLIASTRDTRCARESQTAKSARKRWGVQRERPLLVLGSFVVVIPCRPAVPLCRLPSGSPIRAGAAHKPTSLVARLLDSAA